eukprot:Tamp_08322.p1 GENE.Tamp_08322~~Tamp_08322.p1  ORF type:complete len:631 (+),score=186.87 Tamp_08322:29-1894(+)
MPQEDRYAGAKTFLAKLGFDGAAVDALLVGKVAADTDGLPVPKEVKKAWQHWNLKGHHPDEGGDEEAYNAVKGEYTAFKQNFQAWQQEHPSGQLNFQRWCAASMPASSHGPRSACKQKAELKGKAAAALEAAQVALAQERYEDAAAKGAEAKRLSEEAQSLSRVTDKDVRESITQAIDLIGLAKAGVQRVREEELERRSQKEAMEAFEGLCGYVCAGTLDGGLGWAQKAAAVRECFEDEKRKIERLKTVLGEAQKRHAELAQKPELADQKYQAELEKAAEDKRQISCERDRLTAENTELNEELNQCLRALEKEESTGSSWWDWDPLGWSKRAKKQLSLSQMITKTTQELKRREAELREKVAAMQLKLDEERAARETSAREHASAAATLAEREEEVAAMQLKLDEERAARETSAREHASAAATLAEREEEVTEMQHRLEEERAAREQDVKDKDERVLTLTGELQSLQDELKSLKSQVSHVKSALLGDIVADVQAYQQWAGELEADLHRESRESAKFKVQHHGASTWRVIKCNYDSQDMFQELVRRVREVFGLSDEGLYFQYEDKVGDTVEVHNDIDLKLAMPQFAPSYPKLTIQGTASDKVVAQAGAPTEKEKDGDAHDARE